MCAIRTFGSRLDRTRGRFPSGRFPQLNASAINVLPVRLRERQSEPSQASLIETVG